MNDFFKKAFPENAAEPQIKLERNSMIQIPSMTMPGFRTALAVQNGTEKNLLVKTWGGIGDKICAEPTLRYMLEHFKDCEISLASEHPELFKHLKFKDVFDLKRERPIYENYLILDTIKETSDLSFQFFSHMVINCVDFQSICAFRCMIPIKDREVRLEPTQADFRAVQDKFGNFSKHNIVAIHAGKHWPSKTFPKDWWDSVIDNLRKLDLQPVLIGSDLDDGRSTVNVDIGHCYDMRGEFSIMETVAFLKDCPVLITNDSSPLHMAVSGDTWIGFIATIKHPDFISHWRKGQWSWRMENLGLGGMWELFSNCPNNAEEISLEFIDEPTLRSWLPSPESVAQWALAKVKTP